MNWLLWILLGALSGFLARVLLNRRTGTLWLDIVTGVVGAALGGYLAVQLGLGPIAGLNLYSLLVAVFGACLLLLLMDYLRRLLHI